MDKLASSIERRRMRRLRAKCEVELTAGLSLLDADVSDSDSSLLLLGRTHDLSAGGLGMILPSTTIDERFCSGGNRLNLSLYLPGGVVDLEVSPVRCERLNGRYFGQGYLRERFERYLENLSSNRPKQTADF